MCGILMVAQRAFRPFLAILLPWTAGTWSYITRLLNYDGTHVHNDAKRQHYPEINVLQSPAPSQGHDNKIIPHSACDQGPPRSPLRIRYVPVPGEWERKLHPNWPESTFRIPDLVPDGHIYYIRKGDYVRRGATALVERLPSGHIAKTPLPNPYDTVGEQKARQNMQHEYNVYCFIGPCQFIPKLIDWDSKCKTLVLEDHVNGDLETFLTTNCDTDVDTRQRWALQAAQALASLHNIGVTHQDVTPRNFLLDKNMNLRICDFAGSSFPGHPVSTGAPGPRYQSRAWDREYVPTQADDIFSLGSVLYFIMSGEEPYSKLDEDEVKRRFENLDFPVSDYFGCGAVIQNCWSGQFITAEQVVQALVYARG
ncbi:hypothetical protein AU210_014694 [Fusarium oxysporum f. sp. radicis-cucumerinum]|uniref:EKC/KEOPS complex subunit BUD32 n=1 Tax=Fusarium oxysporum f. sp. radicis-cucumerinum TaxID=327505 RepID=A0A2H3FV60_FUSOX|nr:hypothetical protein AU210_014694 [Fusarium oxysporum f. sp. radicis-cucumerinum]